MALIKLDTKNKKAIKASNTIKAFKGERKAKEKLTEIRIREIMKKKGIKQSELAEAIGVGRSHITRIIDGDRLCISLPIAMKIAKALNTPIDEIFIFKPTRGSNKKIGIDIDKTE
jgi:DNA-binding XRE family transcriptional regulator